MINLCLCQTVCVFQHRRPMSQVVLTPPVLSCGINSIFFLFSAEAVCLGQVGSKSVTGSGSYWAKKVKRSSGGARISGYDGLLSNFFNRYKFNMWVVHKYVNYKNAIREKKDIHSS